jgi:hypothetical protein
MTCDNTEIDHTRQSGPTISWVGSDDETQNRWILIWIDHTGDIAGSIWRAVSARIGRTNADVLISRTAARAD